MPTSNPDWSSLASENERLMDSRASQLTPRPAPSTATPAPAPALAARLRWRRRAAPPAADGSPARRAAEGAAAAVG
jgi:hypothetical protein